MSVTVRDIMRLPCMKDAEIVAGMGGLENVVTAVTVMEYSSYSDVLEKESKVHSKTAVDMIDVQDVLFNNQDYEGSDILITAFSCLMNEPKNILAHIKDSFSLGEAGVIIYYFDLFVKELDQRVIDFADEVGYPIIVMPRDQFQLRYSEAIAEISELIAVDKNKNEYFGSSIMETLVSLPKNQQNISTLLRLLSNYLHLTIALTENDWRLRAFAGWPKILERDIDDILGRISSGSYNEPFEIVNMEDVPGGKVHLIVTGTDGFKKSTVEQITDVVRLYLKMTSDDSHEIIGSGQLIRAIIGDDPIRMRKIAKNMGIDSSRLTNMMIYRDPRLFMPQGETIINEVKENLTNNCHDFAVDIYSGDVVAFLDDGISSHWLSTLEMLNDSMREKGMEPICVYARNLADPSEVREAYQNVTSYLDDARRLYTKAYIISYHEILFAKQMRDIISLGEERIREEMDILSRLEGFYGESGKEIADTLTSFYFDSYMSISETADNLFVHANTVKYRLKKVSEFIGCRVTDMPEMMELYKALALKRLINQ
ncbi:MAG: PucR family transcriptional regulator [Clostridiales bacterium]|nr:PucR family transcriptional regulator [Clostridiales bacterium]